MNNIEYTIPNEIKSETYFGKGMFFFDLAFIVIFWFTMDTFKGLVSDKLYIPFTVFNILIAVILTRKVKTNAGKRVYQVILIRILSFRNTQYHEKEVISNVLQ